MLEQQDKQVGKQVVELEHGTAVLELRGIGPNQARARPWGKASHKGSLRRDHGHLAHRKAKVALARAIWASSALHHGKMAPAQGAKGGMGQAARANLASSKR